MGVVRGSRMIASCASGGIDFAAAGNTFAHTASGTPTRASGAEAAAGGVDRSCHVS